MVLAALVDIARSSISSFDGEKVMQVFAAGVMSDDTGQFVPLCNASLPFEFALQAHQVPDLLSRLEALGWIDASDGHRMTMTNRLQAVARHVQDQMAFNACKIERMVEPFTLWSLTALRSRAGLCTIAYNGGTPLEPPVSLTCGTVADLQSDLLHIVSTADALTDPLRTVTPDWWPPSK
jgi:hypothetical protein